MTLEPDAIWGRLTPLFRDVLDEPDLAIASSTTAKDVPGWDSLTHIQLLVAIERDFGIRFSTGEVAGLANVGEMVALIQRKVALKP